MFDLLAVRSAVFGDRGFGFSFARKAALVGATMLVLAAPAGAAQAPGGAKTEAGGAVAELDLGREEVSLRTRTSRTFVGEDGSYVAKVYPASVNYRGEGGAWQAISNSLVASERAGYGFENEANRYKAFFPARLGDAPIHFELDGEWVSFAPLAVRGESAASVEGSTVRYEDVLPGVALTYTVGPDGVQEAIVLESAAAQSVFEFRVEHSPGLTAREAGAGTVAFERVDGGKPFSFAAPFMADASGSDAGVSSAVSQELVRDADGLKARMVASRAWLERPERVWPVVVDPPISIHTGTRDCHIASSPYNNNSHCGYSYLRVGKDNTAIRRGLLRFELPQELERVDALYASLNLYLENASTSNTANYSVHRVLRPWTGQVTWSTSDGTNSWPGGGDYGAFQWATRSVGPSTGYKRWVVTDLVRTWVNETYDNDGLLVRQNGESTNQLLDFTSVEGAPGNSNRWPYLAVLYMPRIGMAPFYTYETQRLTDRMNLHVNVANGNAVLEARDLTIVGTTGHNADVTRYWNSLSIVDGVNVGGEEEASGLGIGWVVSADIVHLGYTAEGWVVYHDESGRRWLFKSDGSGYTPPPGLDAVLEAAPNGTYKLTFQKTGRVLWFNPNGYPAPTEGSFRTYDATKNDEPSTNVRVRIGFEHTLDGQLGTITDTQGRDIELDYSNGRLDSVTDVAGSRSYTYGFDASDRLSSVTDPHNATPTQYEYDTAGRLTKIIDPQGRTTNLTYDGTRRRIKTIERVDTDNSPLDPDPTWTFDYHDGDSGLCTKSGESYKGRTVVTDPNGHATTYCWDGQSRVKKVVDARGNDRKTSYTTNSNVETLTLPSGDAMTLGYSTDGRNNLRSVERPNGATSTIDYDQSANGGHPFYPSRYTDPQGNTVDYEYDSKGNLSSGTNTLPDGQNAVHIDHFPNGVVERITDPRAAGSPPPCPRQAAGDRVTCFDYFTDVNGRRSDLKKIDNPAPLGDVELTYDAVSRLKTVTDGKSQTTTYTYDELDRLTQVEYEDGSTVEYEYDGSGNRTTRTEGTDVTTYAFDDLNRLTLETFPDTRFNAYDHDPAGNLTSFTDANGTVGYAYNEVNLVTAVTEPSDDPLDPTKDPITFMYNADNNRTQTAFPNGVTMTFQYTKQRLTTIEAKRGTTNLTKFVYDYGTGGDKDLRQAVTNLADDKTAYIYDELNRLKEARTTTSAGTELAKWNYDYDAASNRMSQTVNGVATGYKYDEANQITEAGSTTFSHDANGNLTGSTGGFSASYNVKNQTTDITTALGSLSFTYRGETQIERTTADTTSFLTSALGVTGEQTGTTPVAYTRDNRGGLLSLRLDGDGDSFYYLTDDLGSVVVLTDDMGHPVRTYEYDPFGEASEGPPAQGAPANPWRFVGAHNYYTDEETGLLKVGIRYYDPELGRWMQRDPMSNPIDPKSSNPYVYTGQDPVNFTDPTGAFWDEAVGGLLGEFIEDRTTVLYCSFAFSTLPLAGAIATGGPGFALGLYAAAGLCATLGVSTFITPNPDWDF